MREFLLKLGKAFIIPIALFPAAAIMIGMAQGFNMLNIISAYNLQGMLGGNSLAMMLNSAGNVIFNNISLVLVIAIAITFAKKNKGTAVLAAVMSYLIMNAVCGSLITSFGIINESGDVVLFGNEVTSFLTTTLGIKNSLSMGFIGGIIAGGISVALHNKYNDIKLPEFLGFFGGQRFVPIVASFAALFYGTLLVFIWPFIATILANTGNLFTILTDTGLGWVASGVHGYIERALIPFGLHHIYYIPLWQTSVGGTYDFTAYGGTEVVGTQNAFFAALSLGGWDVFPSTNYMSGKFPIIMFGLPAILFAMYSVADKERKKEVRGLFLLIGLITFFTGITEPIEFMFIFLAPGFYYGVYAVLAGISFALMDICQVKVGMTFSGGFTSFILFGVLPWLRGANNHVWFIIIIGLILAPIYFIVFRWWILKFNIQTLGRGKAVKADIRQEY